MFGQVPIFGACPKGVSAVQDFRVADYLGVWYEQARYLSLYQAATRCTQATYGLNENGTISVLNEAQMVLAGVNVSISGYAVVIGSGRLRVVFPSSPGPKDGSPYWVLKTDYDRFAVVYSCSKTSLLTSAQNVWILTRDRLPLKEVVQEARQALASQGISRLPLIKTDQNEC